MEGAKKTLVYATRAFDPKDENLILARTDGKVGFKQVRWHDFYRFLRIVEKDALVEEIMVFMEEQGMARRHRFSTADLMALSGVPRAIEILDETLADEVKAELESFAGKPVQHPATASADTSSWTLYNHCEFACVGCYQLRRLSDAYFGRLPCGHRPTGDVAKIYGKGDGDCRHEEDLAS